MRLSSLPAPIPATKKRRSWKKNTPNQFPSTKWAGLGVSQPGHWEGVWKKKRLFCSDECLLEDRI